MSLRGEIKEKIIIPLRGIAVLQGTMISKDDGTLASEIEAV
jgi:hypothetical protein